MATVEKFEDLIGWQRAKDFANHIFDMTDKSTFRDFDLKRQMRRAAISPMSNIAEGFGRETRAEFVDALYIARGEVSEARSQLYISFDRKYISRLDFDKGMALSDECSRLIQSFARKVKSTVHRGTQFKVSASPYQNI